MFKSRFEYYRLCYSVIALISLIYILYYNFTIRSAHLWQVYSGTRIIAAIILITGLTIMLICMKKYFFYLSGVNALLKKEDKQNLQVNGLNSYVRHPLYSGTILFVCGIFLWQPVYSNFVSLTCIVCYTIIGAHFEERRLIKIFGNAYRHYASRVPMLFPTLW